MALTMVRGRKSSGCAGSSRTRTRRRKPPRSFMRAARSSPRCPTTSPRDGQVEMASRVWPTCSSRRRVAGVEAGTAPARRSPTRPRHPEPAACWSTGTKNLQEQIALQGHPDAARRRSTFLHRTLKDAPTTVFHRLEQLKRSATAGVETMVPANHPRVVEEHRDWRRSRRTPKICQRTCCSGGEVAAMALKRASEPSARVTTTVS